MLARSSPAAPAIHNSIIRSTYAAPVPLHFPFVTVSSQLDRFTPISSGLPTSWASPNLAIRGGENYTPSFIAIAPLLLT